MVRFGVERERWFASPRPGFGLLLLALAASPAASAFDLGKLAEELIKNADTAVEAVKNSDVLLGAVSPEQELRLGQAAAAVLLGAARPVADQTVQRYVSAVGTWIALQSERRDIPWRFAVLDDDGANAFATPGGYVFVTRGLMLALRDETELAGVLAHEIAHVVARHHLAAMTSEKRFSLLVDLARSATDTDGLLADAAVAATRDLYSTGLEREDEFEADRMGVVLAARAGYDPSGLAHVLMTIEGTAGDETFSGFFLSTHPPTAERLERLDGLLEAKEPALGPPRAAPPPAAFERARAALLKARRRG